MRLLTALTPDVWMLVTYIALIGVLVAWAYWD